MLPALHRKTRNINLVARVTKMHSLLPAPHFRVLAIGALDLSSAGMAEPMLLSDAGLTEATITPDQEDQQLPILTSASSCMILWIKTGSASHTKSFQRVFSVKGTARKKPCKWLIPLISPLCGPFKFKWIMRGKGKVVKWLATAHVCYSKPIPSLCS